MKLNYIYFNGFQISAVIFSKSRKLIFFKLISEATWISKKISQNLEGIERLMCAFSWAIGLRISKSGLGSN